MPRNSRRFVKRVPETGQNGHFCTRTLIVVPATLTLLRIYRLYSAGMRGPRLHRQKRHLLLLAMVLLGVITGVVIVLIGKLAGRSLGIPIIFRRSSLMEMWAGKSRDCCDLRRWQSSAGFTRRGTGYERAESFCEFGMSL